MGKVVCSLSVSADGYIAGPDGSFDWSAPDEELFRYATDEVRRLDGHLLGRRLHETMLFWETADPATLSETEREFAGLWQALPKVVLSTTLSEVQGSSRLATEGLAAEVERWRAGPGEGDLAIGGATLAVAAAALGLVEEYRLKVHPVLVGGGTPYFPRQGRREELELLETRVFRSGVLSLRYGVTR